MTPLERYLAAGVAAGCPRDQMDRLVRASVYLQRRQESVHRGRARRAEMAAGPARGGDPGGTTPSQEAEARFHGRSPLWGGQASGEVSR